MKLLFKQRFFSLLDSFDVYDENGNTVYTVEGQFSIGHCLKIYNAADQEIGTVKQKLLTFLPKFEIYLGNQYVGCIEKEFALFTPTYHIDYNGWFIEGDIFQWDYQIVDGSGKKIARLSKELLNWPDTYSLTIHNPANALPVLMVVLAIDAEKCSNSN